MAGAGPIDTRMDALAFAMLVALATLWGGTFILAEIILAHWPVMTLVATRVALAALALWVGIAVFRIAIPTKIAIWGAFFIMGVVNNAVPFTLIVYGQTGITAGLAAILNATTPLFTALIAALALPDEAFSARKGVGLTLGVIGVAVMIGLSALATLGADLLNQLAAVGATLSYGVAAVYARRFRRLGVHPAAVSVGQLTMSALIMVPLALAIDGMVMFAPAPGTVWVAVFANAVLGTALAYILYFGIISRAGATNAALVTVLVPVVTILVGALALGERLHLTQFMGMELIMAGFLVMDGRIFAVLRRAG
ncbi:MAG: DMT family transporter [Pseudomonadota bacterium]